MTEIHLPKHSNQALGLAQYSIDFMKQDLAGIHSEVTERVELFFADSIACGFSALALNTNAPTILRREALSCPPPSDQAGARCFESNKSVLPQKAILANCAAVREWDSNGTLFGYCPEKNQTRGEFGHNDFYSVPIAAAQSKGLGGKDVLLGMLLTDEIRGRLAQAYSLKDKKIDHVVHGAIAAQMCYGAMIGASSEQLESAVGQFVAHFVPFRAIRHGEQLSDSKGASAAISTEVAIQCVHRAMQGFIGPADIFRNPQALWCQFEDHGENESPFDLWLTKEGKNFAVMDMHFKVGIYEHQSAGALQALIDLCQKHQALAHNLDDIERIDVTIYEPGFSIICDKAKQTPTTRQSADHSLPYILATALRKANQLQEVSWSALMLLPSDYSDEAIRDQTTADLMKKIHLHHGGATYDDKYPEGIPTSVQVQHRTIGKLDSGLVMFPEGHARSTSGNLKDLLDQKFQRLANLAVTNPKELKTACFNLPQKTSEEMLNLYDFEILNNG